MAVTTAPAGSRPVAHAFLEGAAFLAVLGVAFLARFADLGAFVTSDEINFWMQRSERFLAALRDGAYSATAMTTHPGVTTMWLGALGVLLRDVVDPAQLGLPSGTVGALGLMRLPVVLAHTLAIGIGYGILRRLLRRDAAFLAALLWAADPFVIGYSRLLHTDALAGSFGTVSVLAALAYWHHGRHPGMLVLSAVSAALAMLSKSPLVILAPWFALVAAWSVRWRVRDAAPASVSWLLLAGATIVLVWPALWQDPRPAWEQLRAGVAIEGAQPHMLGNWYLGTSVDDPGPWFYATTLAARSTPFSLIGLALLAWLWRREAPLTRRDLALLAAFVIMLTLALTLFPKKFNRYLVPAFPAIDILAASGILLAAHRLRHALPRLLRRRGMITGGIALAVVVNAAGWHPYGIAAFNPLLGGAPRGAWAFSAGWGEGLEQAAAWLNARPDITGVRVASTQARTLQPYLRAGAQAFTPDDGMLTADTGYVVVYLRDRQPGLAEPFARFARDVEPVAVIRIHGVEYAWIWQVAPPVPTPRAALFGEMLELRGYDLDVTPGAADAEVLLTLFWHVARHIGADYSLFAHIINSAGERVAQVDVPYPTSTWLDGGYATTRVPIDLPAALPAGKYRIVIGLYDAASGARLDLLLPPGGPMAPSDRALPLASLRLQ